MTAPQVKLSGIDEACQAEVGRKAVRAMLAWAILESTPAITAVAPDLTARLNQGAAGNCAAFDPALVEADLATVAAQSGSGVPAWLGELDRDLRAMTASGASALAERCERAVDRATTAIVARALARVTEESGSSPDPEAKRFFLREIARGVDARWQALRSQAT